MIGVALPWDDDYDSSTPSRRRPVHRSIAVLADADRGGTSRATASRSAKAALTESNSRAEQPAMSISSAGVHAVRSRSAIRSAIDRNTSAAAPVPSMLTGSPASPAADTAGSSGIWPSSGASIASASAAPPP